ncbi:hypothetical protein H1P_5430001 [Hyella patelloides LEGE 07179]|uniref:Uncharacterized protein n=1 Tax=Hyella patelloides LEGE 07179 TaxID=945734 RepID=A0A563W040_9CYAN|nr:hypothetical protein H1P_5430001 [Hyella patelloides LEGE 07179]
MVNNYQCQHLCFQLNEIITIAPLDRQNIILSHHTMSLRFIQR